MAPAFLYGGGHVKSGEELLNFRRKKRCVFCVLFLFSSLPIASSDTACTSCSPASVTPDHQHQIERSLGRSRRDYLRLEAPTPPHGGLTSFAMRSLGRHRKDSDIDAYETNPFDRENSTSRENSPRLLASDSIRKKSRKSWRVRLSTLHFLLLFLSFLPSVLPSVYVPALTSSQLSLLLSPRRMKKPLSNPHPSEQPPPPSSATTKHPPSTHSAKPLSLLHRTNTPSTPSPFAVG
jgi:hypothetical protein